MKLSRSQRLMLETIHKYDGQWNWYKLGRLCLSKLDSPADFTLQPLLDAGYVQEEGFEGEPLPRLHITQKAVDVDTKRWASNRHRSIFGADNSRTKWPMSDAPGPAVTPARVS
jgi:hypothetical protein